jgi:hypothetical protein
MRLICNELCQIILQEAFLGEKKYKPNLSEQFKTSQDRTGTFQTETYFLFHAAN